jgi:hypothetical protein
MYSVFYIHSEPTPILLTVSPFLRVLLTQVELLDDIALEVLRWQPERFQIQLSNLFFQLLR